MDTAPLLHFVADWTAHYSPTWLQMHSNDYLHARACLEQLSQTLNHGIRRFDPDIINLRPKDMIPDIRPDAPSLRIHIAPGGMRPIPVGYYLCIRSGNRSFLSGGLYASIFGTAADMVRDRMLSDPMAWNRIVKGPAFREHFILLGQKLKNFPERYDPAYPLAPYFQQNNWYVRYPIQDATLMLPDALEAVALQMFEIMSPLIQYLNNALRKFPLPD